MKSGNSEKPAGMKIRYKMLQPTSSFRGAGQGFNFHNEEIKGAAVSDDWAFGPIVKKQLHCPGGVVPASALQFSAGRVFNLPKDFIFLEKRMTDDSMPLEEQQKWLAESDINLVVDYDKEIDQWIMRLHNLYLAELSNDSFQAMSAEELQRNVSDLQWQPDDGEYDRIKEISSIKSYVRPESPADLRLQDFKGPTWYPSILRLQCDRPSRDVLVRFKQLEKRAIAENNGAFDVVNEPKVGTGQPLLTSDDSPQQLIIRTKKTVDHLAFSPDGKRIAVLSRDPPNILHIDRRNAKVEDMPSVELLDAETGMSEITFPLTSENENRVLESTRGIPYFQVGPLKFSPDGNTIVVAAGLGHVKLFDARTGESIRAFDDERAKLAEMKTPKELKARARGRWVALPHWHSRLTETCL